MKMQIVCNKCLTCDYSGETAFQLQLLRNWNPAAAFAKKEQGKGRFSAPTAVCETGGSFMDQHRDYEGELREAGVRLTKPRKIILKILGESQDHPDAMAIFRRAVKIDASISLATVYRTMKLLEGLGAVHRHSFEGGPARFEHADGEHHDHLIDLDTGRVIEFHSETLERLQEQIADELGYDIEHHRLELYGRKRRQR